MTGPVLLYDGLCGFCDWTVQFVIRHDRRGTVRFATLQGDYARELKKRHPWLHEIDSLVLVETDGAGGERVSVRSTGALRLARHLGGPWRLTAMLRIIPRFIRDFAYDTFARHRYRVFGRYDACPLPSADQRARFLS